MINNTIHNKLNECYSKSKYMHKINNSKRNKCPWIDKRIIKACERRDELYFKMAKR